MKFLNLAACFPRLGRLLSVLLVGTAIHARADNVIPTPFPADRYAKMAAQSPFAPPTAPAPPSAQAPPPPKSSFTDKLKATAIAHSDGIYMVSVEDSETQQHLFLTSKSTPSTPNRPPPAMFISSVRWNPAPGKNDQAEITIKKGTEFGVLRYVPSASSAAITPGGPGLAANMPRPGGGGIMPGANRPYTPPAIPGTAPALPNSAAAAAAQRRAPIRGPQPPPATGGRPVVLPGTVTTLAPTVKPGALNADDDDDDE